MPRGQQLPYLLDFNRCLHMVLVQGLRNHEPVAIREMDIILRALHSCLIGGEIAVQADISRVFVSISMLSIAFCSEVASN